MRFKFPRVFRRTPDANSLPVTQRPAAVDTVDRVAYRGGDRASAPASLRTIDRDAASPGRSYLGIVDDLNDGPAPNMIDRGTRALNAGAIGPNAAGYPYDLGQAYFPHTPIPRRPANVTPYTKTIDTSVTVSSISAGTPV